MARLIKLLLVSLLTFQCAFAKSSDDLELRMGLEEVKKELPMNLSEGISWTNIELKDKFCVFTYLYSQQLALAYANNPDMVSDIVSKNLGFAKMIADAGYGLQFQYYEMETIRHIGSNEANNKELKQIISKVEKGEVKKQTFLETIENTLRHTTFPIRLDQVTLYTDGRVEGTKICNYYMIETDLMQGEFNVTPEIVQLQKESLIENLQKTVPEAFKQKFVEENASYLYIYRDSKNKELFRIEILPSDIWK